MILDMYGDYEKLLRTSLKKAGYEVPVNVDLRGLIRMWINLWARQVAPARRTLLLSRHLRGRKLSKNVSRGLHLFGLRCETGGNLNPWLSRKIVDLDYNDDLLNDWGITHFHLGTRVDSVKGLVKGTRDVLFAVVRERIVYGIDIHGHGAWGEIDLLNIVNAEWPDLLRRYKLPHVVGVESKVTGKELIEMRRAGVLVFQQLADGKVIAAPGGGINTAGTNTDHVIRTDATLEWLGRVEEAIRGSEAWIREKMREVGMGCPEELDMEILDLEEERVCLREKATDFRVTLPLQSARAQG